MRKAALLADWFVDSINGNDANTGRNPSQAFQTIGQLESVLAAGETVGFARDSHWREQWDVAIDNVTAIAYGEGERPLFDASDLISPGDWSKTGGLVNVYECTKTPEWGSTNWVNVFEDNAFLIRVADTATCDATPGSCVPSGGGGLGPSPSMSIPLDQTTPLPMAAPMSIRIVGGASMRTLQIAGSP